MKRVHIRTPYADEAWGIGLSQTSVFHIIDCDSVEKTPLMVCLKHITQFFVMHSAISLKKCVAIQIIWRFLSGWFQKTLFRPSDSPTLAPPSVVSIASSFPWSKKKTYRTRKDDNYSKQWVLRLCKIFFLWWQKFGTNSSIRRLLKNVIPLFRLRTPVTHQRQRHNHNLFAESLLAWSKYSTFHALRNIFLQ